MRRKRITIGRRVRRIGFLGKGLSIPSQEKSEIAHALSLRIDEDRISTSDQDRDLYRDDLRPIPEILRGVFSKKPDVVVMADSAKCVADVLDVCLEERIPAVPRGAGSTGLGGAIPVRAGVIIDLSQMGRVLEIDRAKRTVTVEAGCIWTTLEEQIEKEDLCLRCYPSSAPSSTIGGWMSTGGYGMGTLSEGNFHQQVQSMEVALPSGLLVSAGHGSGRYSIGSFAGTEGQIGVITKLTLPVKDVPERKAYYLARLDREEDGFEMMRRLSLMERPPFSVKLVNGEQSRILRDVDQLPTGGKPFMLMAEEGQADRVDDFDKTIRQLARENRITIEDGDKALRLWEHRFSYLKIHKRGPTCLAGEVLIGAEKLPAFLASVLRSINKRRNLIYECQMVDRDRALVLAGYLTVEEYGATAVRDVLATGHIVSLAARVGGVPYGVGLWNSAYSKLVLGEDHKRLKMIKAEIDRLKVLNPGKFFCMTTNRGFPIPGWMYRFVLHLAAAS